ncbi:MAG: hypothetical protein QXP98_04350 [Thermoproteus sp.]
MRWITIRELDRVVQDPVNLYVRASLDESAELLYGEGFKDTPIRNPAFMDGEPVALDVRKVLHDELVRIHIRLWDLGDYVAGNVHIDITAIAPPLIRHEPLHNEGVGAVAALFALHGYGVELDVEERYVVVKTFKLGDKT